MHFERKIKDLKREILQYTEVCKSSSAGPKDYTKLIDAQFALRAAEDKMGS